jgi:hypothetical protein
MKPYKGLGICEDKIIGQSNGLGICMHASCIILYDPDNPIPERSIVITSREIIPIIRII